MTSLHIDVLRSGEGKEGEYKVTEHEPLAPWTQDTTLTVVGRPLPRVEGPDKVSIEIVEAKPIPEGVWEE